MFTILGALAIGLTLGLLGAGGSILTVPVLVYVLGHDNKVAIAESLGIVGSIALFGFLPYVRSKEVSWHSIVVFGLPGMAGTYLGAWLAEYVSGAAQLVLFAVVMLLAAGLMLLQPGRNRSGDSTGGEHVQHAHWVIMLQGLGVGTLTGLVGVGGGFLIVPALVLLGGLPMRLAVGSSLAIIALQSFSGFSKYLGSVGDGVNWESMAVFIFVGVLGTLVGNFVGTKLNQVTLRRVFAVFLVGMGIFVLSREIPHVLANRTAQHTADNNTQLGTELTEPTPTLVQPSSTQLTTR